MAPTGQQLRDNRQLSANVNVYQDNFPGTRALVLAEPLPGLESIAVKDYYNVVIVETDLALASVPVPDFVFYPDDSPYRNNVLYLDQGFTLQDSVWITSWPAISTWRKLNRSLEFFNSNYLKAPAGTSTNTPVVVDSVRTGLDQSEPGVHLARILGCTTIYYTGTSPNALPANLASITAFVNQPGRYVPANLIQPDRATVLNEFYLA